MTITESLGSLATRFRSNARPALVLPGPAYSAAMICASSKSLRKPTCRTNGRAAPSDCRVAARVAGCRRSAGGIEEAAIVSAPTANAPENRPVPRHRPRRIVLTKCFMRRLHIEVLSGVYQLDFRITSGSAVRTPFKREAACAGGAAAEYQSTVDAPHRRR